MTGPSDIVGQILDALVSPFGAFVDRVMTEAAEGRDWISLLEARDQAERGRTVRYSAEDPRFLLRVFTDNRRTFRDHVPDTAFAWASELRAVGNLWAHREPIDPQLARRSADTAALLLGTIGTHDAASEITALGSAATVTDANASAAQVEEPAPTAPELSGDVAAHVDFEPSAVIDGLPHGASMMLTDADLVASLRFEDALNFAFAHNGVSPLHEFVLENIDDEPVRVSSVEVDVVAPTDAPLTQPVRLSGVELAPGETVFVPRQHLRLRLDPKGFEALTEALPNAEVSLTVTTDRGRLHGTAPIKILARNEWWFSSSSDVLAAFVRPADKSVLRVVSAASDLLRDRTGNPSFQGYQNAAARAYEEARAVFDAMSALEIRYIDPPPSFEGTGQKLRDHRDVIDDRFGTCIDLATTFAAALEYIGLNPVIVVARNHAFGGFLADEGQLDEFALSATTHRNTIANLVDSGALIPIETVALTAGGSAAGFAGARAAASEHFRKGLGDIEYVLDVRAAHRRVRPIPTEFSRTLGESEEHAPAIPVVAPAELRRPESPPPPRPGNAEAQRAAFPARVDKWRNSLLDLSFRNPLLNLRTRTSGLDLHVPIGALAKFEDGLAAGTPYKLVPHDSLAEIHKLQGARSAQDLAAQELARILLEERTAFCSITADRFETRLTNLQRRARTVEQETGANNLYLTLGSLNWTDGTRERVDAPLFLLPVRLVGSRHRGFSLQIEDGGYAVPNQCLLEKLRLTYNLRIPAYEEPQLDDSGIDLPDALQQIRLALLDAKLDFRVDEVARLAIIQFSTLQMWQDLSANWQSFAKNPVVRHMIENPTDSFDDGDWPEFDASLEYEAYLPVAADSSQIEAIQWAAQGRSFVLEGPPGTGKSQTITNMIAHLLAMGKRVLFVAEKQAALGVVKRRLDASGLGPFALDVHGRNQTPAEVRRQLREALNYDAPASGASWGALRAQYRTLVAGLEQYPSALHEVGPAGESAWSARQTILALGAFGTTGEVPSVSAALVRDAKSAEEARRLAPNVAEVLQVFGDDPTAHRWLISRGDIDIDDSSNAVSSALAELRSAVDELQREPYSDLAHAITRDSDFEAAQTWLDSLATSPARNPRDARAIVTEAWVAQLATAEHSQATALAKAHDALADFAPTVIDFDLASSLARSIETDGKLLKKRRRRAIAADLASVLLPGREVRLGTLTALLTRASEAVTAARAARQLMLSVPGLDLPSTYNPLDAELQGLPRERAMALHSAAVIGYAADRVVEAAERLLSGSQAEESPVPSGLFGPPPIMGAPTEESGKASVSLPRGGAALARLLGAWNAFLAAIHADEDRVAQWRGNQPLLEAIEAALPQWEADAAGGSFLKLRRWCNLLDACERLEKAGLGEFGAAILEGRIEAHEFERLARYAIARAALDERLETMGLTSFDEDQRTRLTERFLESGEDLRGQLVAELPARIVAARSFAHGRLIGKVGELDREVSRKRGGLTIRGMFERYGSVIGEVTPCLLMSPHSIARFLPAGAIDVDVVIFDEASQIRVAEAIGAVGRGASVVVVGDSRQMPPTAFAQVQIDEPEEESHEVSEILAPADQESILTEAVEMRMPRLWLTWHYRSEDESLIAFSNARYYEGRLSSFPGPPVRREGLGITFRRVSGVFDRGRTRTNQVEGDAIVADIRRRLAEDEHASIGVVTFNAQQADLLLTKLEECGDPRVATALALEDDASALFVKNLENVQGDERDTILFSLAFSVDPATGQLPLNFGPLNRAGGERRLNVAITRARKEVALFASFDPEHIDERRTSAAALLDLKEYLIHAREATTSTSRIRQISAADLHRDEVCAHLRARGLEVVEDVGMSSFRVDIAVRKDPQSPWVAILLDGPNWRARRTVGDRDALPTTVLKGRMGWQRVERIYLPAWLNRQSEVLDRIEATATAAQHGPDSATEPAPIVRPQPAERLQVESNDDPAPARYRAYESTPAPASAPAGRGGHALYPDVAAFAPASQDRRTHLSQWVLDALPERYASRSVGDVAQEVIAEEGPIQEERLAKIVARRYGLERVRQERVDRISATVPRTQRRRTFAGVFVWPTDVSPDTYMAWRYTPASVERSIDEIAPEEVANAMAWLAASAHGIPREELIRETAQAFAIQRIASQVRSRLESNLQWAIKHERLADDDGLIGPGTAWRQ